MSATTPCLPSCCATSQVVNVPGVPGDNGINALNGSNAFTLTTAPFNVPAVGSSVTVPVAVADSTWMIVGQNLIFTGPATFLVTAIPTTTSVTLTFLGYPGDVAPGVAILTGTKVGVAGQRGGSTVYYLATAANLALTAFMDAIEVTADAKTMTLPTAVGISGKIYTIKLSAAGVCTVATSGGQTIDGVSTFSLHQFESVSVISNGANWLITVRNANHVVTTAVDYLATLQDDVIEITGATKTITLPTAVGIAGKVYVIKITANSTATIQANGAETIDAGNTAALSAQYKYKTIVSDGAGWLIIANN